MLSVSNVRARYGAVTALDDVTVGVDVGKVVCVLGPNGAGKSTLIRVISGQVPFVNGEITFLGRSLRGMPAWRIARLGIVQCPEGRQLFNTLTVGENLRMGAAVAGGDLRRVVDTIDFVADIFPVLRERWSQRAGTLSGGEQQMVALGRSLVARPQLLLLDEPSLGLAPIMVSRVFQAIPKIAAHGISMILVEQNAKAAIGVSDGGYILHSGTVRASGAPPELDAFIRSHDGYLGIG